MSLKVVYIDDEPALCEIISEVLELAGHEVKTFVDPNEEISYIRSNTPPQI